MPAPTFLSQIQNRVRVEHVFFAILIVAIILRFSFLDLKLFHHDEAIHAWFSYQLLTEGTYIYDPVYHGPFLYYVRSITARSCITSRRECLHCLVTRIW